MGFLFIIFSSFLLSVGHNSLFIKCRPLERRNRKKKRNQSRRFRSFSCRWRGHEGPAKLSPTNDREKDAPPRWKEVNLREKKKKTNDSFLYKQLPKEKKKQLFGNESKSSSLSQIITLLFSSLRPPNISFFISS